MKLFVTGGAGFIGSNFIRYWLAHHPGDEVVNFDKLTYAGNLENLAEVDQSNNYRFIQGDICDPNAVTEAMKGMDTVVHFAAESHVDRSIVLSAPFIQTNIIGTHVLLEQSLQLNIKRFHHVSTDEVYGSLELHDTSKFNERTRYDPRSPYAASKAGSDHLVHAYWSTYGLPITISNCSNNFGPYQFPEKFISLAITNLLEDKKIPVYGDGLYVRDWLYVEDHCRAIDLILSKGKIGETYCIGGFSFDVNNLDVIRNILKKMNKNETSIEYVKDRPGHDRRYAIDWRKINTDLGWKPQSDFDSLLDKTIDWYKQHESWWRRIKSGEYRTYYQKQYGRST